MAHGEDAWLIPLESVGTLSTAPNVGRPRDSNTENVTIVQIHGFDAMPTSVMPKGVEHLLVLSSSIRVRRHAHL